MRRIIIFILLAVSLVSCETRVNEPATKPEPKPAYQFVEPEENVAQLVWDALKTQHPKVKPVYDMAVDLEFFYEEDITTFENNIYMKYEYFVPRGSEEPDNLLVAIYELNCYQTFDNSWLAIVTKDARGYELDEEYVGKEIFTVEYKDGQLTDRDVNALFPESFKIVQDYFRNNYYDCFIFNNDHLIFSTDCYWPIKYNWNGETFDQDPESVIMENAVENFHGFFRVRGASGLSLGNEPNGLDENDDFVRDGRKLAHFLLEDGKVVGYTLEDPICGFVQLDDYLDGVSTIVSKPVAIGYPIQNVLDYEKKPFSIKDTTAVARYVDNRYVITQQLMHNTLERFDIFIEFTAKDEQSDIETILVYTQPIVVTLESELEEDHDINEKTKALFRAINFDDSGLGEYYYLSGYENGFTINYKGDIDEVRFQTYPFSYGGTFIVLAQLPRDRFGTEYECWEEMDGDLQSVAYFLPSPKPEDFPAWNIYNDTTIPSDGYRLKFTNEGIEYYTLSEQNDGNTDRDEWGNYINPDFYTVKYPWDGQFFDFKK